MSFIIVCHFSLKSSAIRQSPFYLIYFLPFSVYCLMLFIYFHSHLLFGGSLVGFSVMSMSFSTKFMYYQTIKKKGSFQLLGSILNHITNSKQEISKGKIFTMQHSIRFGVFCTSVTGAILAIVCIVFSIVILVWGKERKFLA